MADLTSMKDAVSSLNIIFGKQSVQHVQNAEQTHFVLGSRDIIQVLNNYWKVKLH